MKKKNIFIVLMICFAILVGCKGQEADVTDNDSVTTETVVADNTEAVKKDKKDKATTEWKFEVSDETNASTQQDSDAGKDKEKKTDKKNKDDKKDKVTTQQATTQAPTQEKKPAQQPSTQAPQQTTTQAPQPAPQPSTEQATTQAPQPAPTPVHQHQWEVVYKEVPKYEEQTHNICRDCGLDLTAAGIDQDVHFENSPRVNIGTDENPFWTLACGCSYRSSVKVQVGTEKVVDYYRCSCGATKK